MPSSYLLLGLGILVALGFYRFVGRTASLIVTTLWIACIAFFLMEPAYSFRIESAWDVAALALCGVVGLVFVRHSHAGRPAQHDEWHDVPFLKNASADLEAAVAEAASSAGIREQIQTRHIELTATPVQSLACSHEDAVRALTGVLVEALKEDQLRRVSFQVSRRPGVETVYVDAHTVWPRPLQQAVTIGKHADECTPAEFADWPPNLSAAWFDDGTSRIYQISSKIKSAGCLPETASEPRPV